MHELVQVTVQHLLLECFERFVPDELGVLDNGRRHFRLIRGLCDRFRWKRWLLLGRVCARLGGRAGRVHGVALFAGLLQQVFARMIFFGDDFGELLSSRAAERFIDSLHFGVRVFAGLRMAVGLQLRWWHGNWLLEIDFFVDILVRMLVFEELTAERVVVLDLIARARSGFRCRGRGRCRFGCCGRFDRVVSGGAQRTLGRRGRVRNGFRAGARARRAQNALNNNLRLSGPWTRWIFNGHLIAIMFLVIRLFAQLTQKQFGHIIGRLWIAGQHRNVLVIR